MREFLGRVGQQQFGSRHRVDALQRITGHHGGAAHRHRFQDFVLDAPRDAHGRHASIGMSDISADIRHPACHEHTRDRCQRLHFRRGARAHNMKLRGGHRLADQGQYLLREPDHGIHIGRVIHRAGENEIRLVQGIGRLECVGRIEIVEIHAIADTADAIGILRLGFPEQIGFGVRDECGPVAFADDPGFQFRHPPPFAVIDLAHGKRRHLRIGTPFLGIDVDQVDQSDGIPRLRQIEDIGRHIGRADHDDVRFDGPHHLANPVLQSRVAIEHHAECLACQKTSQGRDLGITPVDLGEIRAGTHSPHGGDVLHVVRIVHQTAQMNVMGFA